MRLALILAIAFCLAPACASAQSPLGLMIPMSGPAALLGVQVRAGVEQAIADLGAPLRLVVVDDGGETRMAVPAAEALVAGGARIIVGPLNSGVALAVMDVAAEAEAIVIAPTATHPLLTEKGRGDILRLAPRDDAQGAVLARLVARELPAARPAILVDGGAYGRSIAEVARATFAAETPSRAVIVADAPTGEREFTVVAGRLRAAGVDAVIWAGEAQGAGFAARRLRVLGPAVAFFGPETLAEDDFVALAGEAAIGARLSVPADMATGPEAEAILARLRARLGGDPTALVLRGYAAVQAIVAGMGAVGENPRAIAERLKAGPPVETVLGPIGFDAKGDRIGETFAIWTIERGRDGRPLLSR